MKAFSFLFLLFGIPSFCYAQSNSTSNLPAIGGPCEGCEAIFEYGNQNLSSKAILPDYYDRGQKIKISGTVFQKDGQTPAPNVILYIYHTDQSGKYIAKANAKGWEKRHGSIRGWVKTGEKGQYTFYTLKPKAYPSRTEPAHIHLTVKEPAKNEYYMDSYYFDDDPLLSSKIKKMMRNRGGRGIISLQEQEKCWIGKRDIILGLNIPDYW